MRIGVNTGVTASDLPEELQDIVTSFAMEGVSVQRQELLERHAELGRVAARGGTRLTGDLRIGTSNTVVARWNFAREEPQTMSFPAITAPGSGAMPPVTPSVLYYRGEESFLMGYEVTSRGLDDIRSSRYFWGFKRGLLHLTSLYEDRGREFSADHIARLYLTRLLGNLELNADTVVTFTAPVNAFDTYREWISAFFAEKRQEVFH